VSPNIGKLTSIFLKKYLPSHHINGTFSITSEKATYSSDYVIIATGFYDIPKILNIEGEQLPKVKHYYDEAHFYAFQKVAVIGAMNSAVDAALETYRKGAEVTMIIRSDTDRRAG
jgi:thioredoxin reductase (NADPH)